MYSRDEFIKDCSSLFDDTAGNLQFVPGIGETLLYDHPLTGFADASDVIFETFRNPEVVGSNYMGPSEWLHTAETVVSFFFPASEAVRASNKENLTEPSLQWLYARVEGQDFINSYMSGLKVMLEEKGSEVCVPSLDGRFGVKFEDVGTEDYPDFHADSRWSERHAAYACGLGTFGLSRGLITERGMAGRFASLIVSEKWKPSDRKYTGYDDYCIKCGVCARNCPAQAITPEHGKNNIRCNAYLDKMKEKYSPRYGCGKCQVKVPCEFHAPGFVKMNMA